MSVSAEDQKAKIQCSIKLDQRVAADNFVFQRKCFD